MSELSGKRVTVVGLGESGAAAVRVLSEAGATVRVSEAQAPSEVTSRMAVAEAAGAEVLAGGHRHEHLDDTDLVVVSPGVPEAAPVLSWAAERGIPIWSELELGARVATCPYVAVTGTNGKTTTTKLIAEAMRRAGLDAIACGNVGYPFSLAAAEGHEALAVEASSFQLRFHHTFHPRVSVLLNVAEDHTDWHGSFQAYLDAKRRIYLLQGGDDVHVGNLDDGIAAAVSGEASCRLAWFTSGEPAENQAGFEGGELVWRSAEGTVGLGRPFADSPSHMANGAAAAAVAISFGIDPGAVGEAIRETEPPPHRGETVVEIGGVSFVDDSKATNPHAALATIGGFKDAVLICGGRSKGIDLSPMAEAIPHLSGAVVIGEAAAELLSIFGDRIPVRMAGSMEEAVQVAFDLAGPVSSVVLAPGCSSWDMFKDYAERGDRFAAAAKSIERTRAAG